jgi:hypothetical protein
MYKDLMLIVKYPYAAMINSTIWLSTIALMLINRELPILSIVTINMVATFIVSYVGFTVEKR